ncbi:Hypothetical predicted protein [Paramuricea clavata]|uniref:Transposable element P transposase-like GTP-binding insertion domain-containing protein n=1 Tax=Paramuricea clavata TaxID=317549 RepID=A0A7D9EGW6_PARCT|nr:Hypothetical predicted protein [Paramuricea clavata]
MKVKLAVQVLSRTVSTCLLESDDPSVAGTAMFCQMVNDLFDCLNDRLLKEHQLKRNDCIKPYDSPDDECLVWMKNTFLQYLEDWKESVAKRKGSYTTERFMEDVLEDYFGHHRTLGVRSDNSSAEQFRCNDRTLAAQRDIDPSVSGNTGGRYGKDKWYTVSDEPLKGLDHGQFQPKFYMWHDTLRVRVLADYLSFNSHAL